MSKSKEMEDIAELKISSPSNTLSSELYLKAKEELGETAEERDTKIEMLRNWIKEESDSKLFMTYDDISLLWFLRSCKFDVLKAQKRIKTFAKFRATVPEWYQNRDPLLPQLSKLLDIGCFLPLPGKDLEDRKVVLIRAAAHDPRVSSQDDVFKICNMVMELACRDDESISITGTVAIVDLQGVSLGHVVQLTPSMIRKAVASWQEVYPVRMKGMHYVNAPFNVNLILNIFRKFMKEKLRQRLHVHRNINLLPKFVPMENLPPEYGGSGIPLQGLIEETKDHLLRNRDWFLHEETHGPFS